MKARRGNMKGSKARVPRAPKPPPPPPVIKREADGQLVKIKQVYSNGPRVKKITELNSAWCGIPPYQSTVPCVFVSQHLNQYAEAIIMAVNQKNGTVPDSGLSFNYGKLRIYLLAAVYSHLSKLGAINTDTMKWLKFGKYRIPTSFALALQDLGTYKHPETGALFTPELTDLTEAYFTAFVSTEGSTVCPVVVGHDAALANEPYFGAGLSIAGIDDLDCDSISNIISSAMESVQTQYVPKFANSAAGFISPLSNEMFMAVDEVSNVSLWLSLSYSSVNLGPCIFRAPGVVVGYGGAAGGTSAAYINTHVLLSMEMPYEYKLRSWSAFTKFGVDHRNVQIMMPIMSFSVMAGLILDWLINIGVYQANSGGNNTTFNNWLNLVYAYLLAKTPFPGRMFVNSAQAPFYVSPSHTRIGMPSCIGNIGLEPTRSCNTIIIPSWPSWAGGKNCMNTFSSGNVYTGTFDDAEGSLPFNGTTSAAVTLASYPTPSTANLYNACYLFLKEEISNQERSNLNNQTVEFDINKPYCPCAVSYNFGLNTDVNAWVQLPRTDVMACYRAVGSVECKAQMGVALDIRVGITSYYKTLSDATQNRYRIVTEAAKFGNNVTQLVATNSGAAWKQASAGYFSNLASKIEWERGSIHGSDLIKAANYYLQSGGVVEGLPDPGFWASLQTKDYNLEELVSKVAAGIAYVTPAVRTAVAAYKAIRTHYPVR